MSKNIVVPKNDYEYYTFSMPLLLNKERRKRFICKELEKRHPYFSDECSMDISFFIKNKRLNAGIAVMDKLTLEHYRKKASDSLCLEEFGRKRFFKNQGRLFFLHTLALLGGIVLVLWGLLFYRPLVKKTVPAIVPEHYISEETIEKAKNNVSPQFVCNEILDRIMECGGELVCINLMESSSENECNEVQMSMEIHKMYPEQLIALCDQFGDFVSAHCSAVSYIQTPSGKSVPSFSLNVAINQESNCEEKMDILDVIPVLRKCIVDSGGKIKLENMENGYMECSVPVYSFKRLLRSLVECCKENNFGLNSICIEKENDTMQLRLYSSTIVRDMSGVFDKIASAMLILDIDNQKWRDSNPLRFVASSTDKVHKEKIGKITDKSGKTFVFYRDVNGKITGEEE